MTTETPHERLRREAWEAADKEPDLGTSDERSAYFGGYVAGGTISQEKLEQAAKRVWACFYPGGEVVEEQWPEHAERCRRYARAALMGAGMVISDE